MPDYPPGFPSFDIIPADRETEIAGVLARLSPMYARDIGGLTDDERGAWTERRESLTQMLCELPTADPDHIRAKLRILCHRLRWDLPHDEPGPVTTYILAESLREDLEGVAR